MNFNRNLSDTNKAISDLDSKISTDLCPEFNKNDDTSTYLSPEALKTNFRQFSNASNSSSNYSNQTHQSSTSQASHLSNGSVVHNPSSISTSNFKSNVLDFIKNNDEDFNPNNLFQQRQQRSQTNFITKLDDSNKDFDQTIILTNKESSNTLVDDFTNDNDSNKIDLKDDNHLSLDQSSPIDGKKAGSIFFDDDYENDYDYDYEDDDDYNDDDLPSPPRSPPKEIDPDKLYGLYDFSGPDPSHCSISRDEPVYLINDQDNYWWLIRKLSKQERIQLVKARNLNKSEQDLHSAEIQDNSEEDEEYLLTDEEDGKVGFVPAECLETYGERLARLNCFKNEELEKSSKDLIISSNPSSSENFHGPLANKSDSSFGLGSPVNFQKTPDTTLSRSGSILKDGTKQSINKSVTFEDLGELELNEESEDNEEQFPSHYNIPEIEEIHQEMQNKHHEEEEKRSEVLSDVYPSETPLVINKRKSISDSPSPTKESEIRKSDVADLESDNSIPPNTPQSSYQTPIVTTNGMFTPGSGSTEEFKTPADYKTPKSNSKSPYEDPTPKQEFKTPEDNHSDYDYSDYTNEYYKNEDEENGENMDSTIEKETSRTLTPNSERLRRSQILNKLNQVTSDIQNELQDFATDDGFDEDDYVSVFKNDISGSFSKHSINSKNSIESKSLTYDNNKSNSDHFTGYHNADYEVGSGYGDILNQIEESYEYDPKEINVTPLTSVNSLSNSKTEHFIIDPNTVERSNISVSDNNIVEQPAKPSMSTSEKRKSKPVHEMFVPILGKFDKLAEKLAEIDEML